MAIFYFSYIYVFIFVSVVRPHFFIEAVACRLPSLAFSCAKLWRPCQMPSTRERSPYLAKTFLEAFRK